MSVTLHSGGWLFYAAAAVLYLADLVAPRAWLARLATAVLAIGFVGHSVCFAFQFAGGGMGFESRALVLSVFAWGIVAVFLGVQLAYRVTVVGAFVAPVATLFALLAEMAPGAPGVPGAHVGTVPALSGAWLTAHIVAIVLGYAAFAVSFCVAVIYVMQERFLKARKLGALFRRLPSLDSLDRLNQLSIVAGFGLLSVGLFIAAAIATVNARPDYRIWADPQVIFAGTLWVWYAAAVQSRLFAGWRGRKSAVFSIVGFVVMVVSFVGIGLASSSFHVFGRPAKSASTHIEAPGAPVGPERS